MEFMCFKMTFIIALSLMGSVVNSQESLDYKLPNNFKPASYQLNVTTYLEDIFWFEGAVDIYMSCIEVTDTIILHSSSLYINSKSVVVSNGGKNVIPVDNVLFDQGNGLMFVKSTVQFKQGEKYVLTIPFTGNITDNLVGYYKSSYVDKESNQTRWLAVTQFKPMYARSAFPCFDEPALKATFKIRLGHKKGLTSISNMKFMNETPLPSKPDYVFDEFNESVPMSTYLVAYMVSDFAYFKADSKDKGVEFRVIARKDAANQTGLANDLGPKVLKYYEDYFNKKFPLSKQDMVVIPDFFAFSMENCGLITYRETVLLIDLNVATIYDVLRVAEIITQNLAHQWLGDLVTMKWWTDYWLNEGFAMYFSAFGVDFLYPEWNYFQFQTVQNFLNSLQSSNVLLVDIVGYPYEISQVMDIQSYNKVSFLLHMINMFLGENTFKQGIRNYIKKYKFSNADHDDLWSSLTEEAQRQGTLDINLSVKQIMDKWTLQAGYPVLKVVRDYSKDTVTLSQNTEDKRCWWIPITMTTSKEANFNQTKAESWLNCENNNLTKSLSKDIEWVIYNMQMAGLFRVLYDTRNWMGIISTLNDPKKYTTIHKLNRVQLIDDSFSFSQSGDIDYEITFQLLKYLKHEIEYVPWVAAFKGLNQINEFMKRTPNQEIFQNYTQRLLSPVYGKFLDMTGEHDDNSFEKISFKKLLTMNACYYQIKNCTEQSLVLFRKWMKITDPDNDNILPRELRPVIYCQAIKYGGADEWNFLWERYQRSNLELQKYDILLALGCSSETWLLNRYLNWSIDNSIISEKNSASVFNAIATNDVGFSIAKDFLYHNISNIYDFHQFSGATVGTYVQIIGKQMKTKEELDEIQSFISKSSGYLQRADSIIDNTMKTIDWNIEWTSKFYNKTVNYIVQ